MHPQMVDAARENEASLRETIEQLRQEIASMNTLVDQGSGVAASHVCYHFLLLDMPPSIVYIVVEVCTIILLMP